MVKQGGAKKFKKKHPGRCDEKMTCYKCGRTGQYSTGQYECGDDRHISNNCPKKNNAVRPNILPKPKAMAYHMILDAERCEADVA